VTISFGYILYCVCFKLYCGGFILFYNVRVCMCGFCNVRVCVVCVCVCFVMCGCFGKMCTLTEDFLDLTEVFLTLTSVFRVFFPQLKGKCQGKTRKDGARPSLFYISCYLCCSFVIYVVLCIVCVEMCTATG